MSICESPGFLIDHYNVKNVGVIGWRIKNKRKLNVATDRSGASELLLVGGRRGFIDAGREMDFQIFLSKLKSERQRTFNNRPDRTMGA
ncbi:MAG: hypothetical protein WBW71_12375 [Bacteroidota bacterium]